MHLIESYSSKTLSTISEPFIFEKYYPLLSDKYITLHSTSKESKTYSYWQDVIDEILPYLKKNKIDIVQIGAEQEMPIKGCLHTMGKTSINQVAYIIKNSIAHLGVDSFPVHIASSFNKKICSIYSNNFIKNVGPFFSNKDDLILLEPERNNGEKPSFAINGDRSIDKIKPELIASSILKLLNIEYEPIYKTLWIGPSYNNRMVHLIPNQNINPSQLGLQSLIVRMDIEFNENILLQQLQICPCSIITSKPINLNLLRNFKSKILEIVYIINKNNSKEFVREIANLRIKYKLISELENSELNKIKLDYLDFNIIIPKDESLPNELTKTEVNKIYYKTTQFYLSSGKIYSSEFAYRNNLALKEFCHEFQPIYINELSEKTINFLKREKDFIYFAEKID